MTQNQKRFNRAAGAPPSQDIYTRVTNKIIADLETGVLPWQKPWDAGSTARIIRPLRGNGVPYNGINILLLWSAALENGYQSPMWMTYRQAKELGAHVRAGEHGSMVVYAGAIEKEEHNAATGEDESRTLRFLKAYTVFNTDQIDGLPDQYRARPPPKFANDFQRDEHAEAFIANTRATIYHGGGRAFYAPSRDTITLPPREAFTTPEAYYSTAIHELGHWTQHPSRLDMKFGSKSWMKNDGYAMGELFAELTACFVCADLELTPEVTEEHTAYISHWLDALKADKRAIFTAAAFAQRSVEYLYALQPHEAAPAAEPTSGKPEMGPP